MPSLEELRAADSADGIECLRTLQMKYINTINRLPLVGQEMNIWLKTSDINHRELARDIEMKIISMANWLSDYDLLSSEIKSATEFQSFMARALKSITLNTAKFTINEYQIAKEKQIKVENVWQIQKLKEEENLRIEKNKLNEINRENTDRDAYRNMVIKKEKEILR